MNVVSRRVLIAFWRAHPDAEAPLTAWFNAARTAIWTSPHDIKAAYGSAELVGDNRVVFNIGGNKYRLVVRVSYVYKQVLIKFVGTHAEYDAVDVTSV